MNTSYTLSPNNFFYEIEKHFPILPDDQKMGVFISGGMESTLISLIAQKIYGKDRVVNFFSDNIFSSNDTDINTYIRTNITQARNLLGVIPVYLEFDYELHVSNRKDSIKNKIMSLKESYNIF